MVMEQDYVTLDIVTPSVSKVSDIEKACTGLKRLSHRCFSVTSCQANSADFAHCCLIAGSQRSVCTYVSHQIPRLNFVMRSRLRPKSIFFCRVVMFTHNYTCNVIPLARTFFRWWILASVGGTTPGYKMRVHHDAPSSLIDSHHLLLHCVQLQDK